jgi:transcriptional regulator with XRE-family HTH domain
MNTHSNSQQAPFGVLLRRWRQRRRLTQMEFADAASSSTRHLSYLETGRAQPSREMVVRLAEHLDIPLRERNLLLLAAGFAPAYPERSFEELSSARQAIEQVIHAHRPYPAFAVDRHWNIVFSNRVLPQLYVDVSAEILRPPVNVIRLMLHPDGMAPRIVNLPEWRRHVITVLRQQIEARAEAGVQALLSEIMDYPSIPSVGGGDVDEGSRRFATPLQIATDSGVISFLNTTTVFGTPTDITLSELALEMLFPANPETVAIVSKLSADNSKSEAGMAEPAKAD